MSKKINPKQEIRKALKHCENSQFSDAIIILQTVLEKYPNQIEALTILGNVYLHQKDICHRDIKPENFLLYKEDDPSHINSSKNI